MDMFRVDTEIFRSINNLAGHGGWLDVLGIFSARYLIWVMAGVILAAAVAAEFGPAAKRPGRLASLAGWFRGCPASDRPDRMTVAAVRALLAAGAAYLGNFIISLIHFRPRPCGVLFEVNNLLQWSCVDKSFPSDHSSLAFTMAFSVLFVRPVLGSVLLVGAAFVAWGRVFVGVHYPGDVLAGALVGLVWALVIRAVEARFSLTAEMRRFCSDLRRGKT